jgi:hypothetical protein
MGRASNHKKARRRTAHTTSREAPGFQAEGRRQLRLLADMEAQHRMHVEREQAYMQACRAWCSGREPIPAATPPWVHGKFGERFAANPFLGEVQNAPCLVMAVVPPAAVVVDDPAQWQVAVNTLIRAVAFDGLDVGHPAVSALLDALAPVVKMEVRCWPAVLSWLRSEERQRNQPAPGFPLLDGPVASLGTYILSYAALAVTGGNPGNDEVAVLSRALDGAIPGVAGSVVADALTGTINPLQALTTSGAVRPADLLQSGLAVLSAFIQLFEADVTEIPRRVA